MSARRDIYDHEAQLVSVDNMPPELLHKLSLDEEFDEKLERNKEAAAFAVELLTEDELQLLFFRYFQGHSHKTLKKTLKLGSTKTAAKQVEKLTRAIRMYIEYYLEADLVEDLNYIQAKLGDEAKVIASLLFRRFTRHRIFRYKLIEVSQFKMSQVKLNKIAYNIETMCLEDFKLAAFYRVIIGTDKSWRKKKK